MATWRVLSIMKLQRISLLNTKLYCIIWTVQNKNANSSHLLTLWDASIYLLWSVNIIMSMNILWSASCYTHPTDIKFTAYEYSLNINNPCLVSMFFLMTSVSSLQE